MKAFSGDSSNSSAMSVENENNINIDNNISDWKMAAIVSFIIISLGTLLSYYIYAS